MAEMFHPDLIWANITDLSPAPVVGWTAIEADGVWSFSAPIPPVPTSAELKAAAMAKRDALLSAAGEATAGMADAYIAGLLDTTDTATFKAFAAYQLALGKIDKQPGYPAAIDWPTLVTP
jgi:hypothetical protein